MLWSALEWLWKQKTNPGETNLEIEKVKLQYHYYFYRTIVKQMIVSKNWSRYSYSNFTQLTV